MPKAFPDVNQGKLLAGFRVEDFRLWFPRAAVVESAYGTAKDKRT